MRSRDPVAPRVFSGSAVMLVIPLWLVALWGLSPEVAADSARKVDSSRSHVAQIQQRGFLWVRCFPQQISPFLAVNTEKGAMPTESGPDRFQGVDIDILMIVAQQLGVQLRIHPGLEPTISSSFEALESGHGDLVAGGLTITELRKKRFDFSVPYFPFKDLILGPAAPETQRASLHGSRLAVMAGSSFDEMVQEIGIRDDLITRYDFVGEAYESVACGDNDFTFADSTMLNPDTLLGVQVAYRIRGDRGYGYVLPQGSDLKAVIDRVIQRLEESGELEQILEKNSAYGTTDLSVVSEASWQDFVAPQ